MATSDLTFDELLDRFEQNLRELDEKLHEQLSLFERITHEARGLGDAGRHLTAAKALIDEAPSRA
jgi:hypothetical protein